MVSDVRIQIGEDDSASCSLDEICDRWVRARITELREKSQDCRFKLSFEYEGRIHAFSPPSPNDSITYYTSPPRSRLLIEIDQLWHFTGLNSPAYTASAAIVFLRRFRQYLS